MKEDRREGWVAKVALPVWVRERLTEEVTGSTDVKGVM